MSEEAAIRMRRKKIREKTEYILMGKGGWG
jgi:hypothetical protein